MSLRQSQVARNIRFSKAKTIPLPELKGTSLDGGVQTYTVGDISYSENAVLLFCHNMVIKRILAYTDRRYNLEKLHDRHLCLLESLEWNRKFTDKVHLGLAPVREWKVDSSKTVNLGKTLIHPQKKDLDPDTEYVLLMRKLPKEYRLDYLLTGEASISQQCHAYVLTEYLSNFHKSLERVLGYWRHTEQWGCVSQILTKLEHNLNTVDEPVGVKKEVLQSRYYRSLKSASARLKKELLPIFHNQEYCSYFEKRVSDGYIKRCHGDLKARNIWILPFNHAREKYLQEGVNLLDAIDFNPEYCNIDILSDFAMLAVDLQVRTSSNHLASYVIEDYLHQSEQTDKASRKLLNYYLVEKAFVGAYVNILYDNRPDLGEAYLQEMQRNLAKFKLR